MVTFKRVSIALSIAVLLAGCSSGVKLDESASANSGANTTSGNASGVSNVDLTASQIDADGGPKGVGRVVYFEFDSFSVTPQAQGVVEGNAQFIKADPSRKVTVQGHTDERGGREYNLALGQKRAEAVRRSLNLLGVSDSQVEAVSYGEEKPAATGNNEAAYAQNRRAEISYR